MGELPPGTREKNRRAWHRARAFQFVAASITASLLLCEAPALAQSTVSVPGELLYGEVLTGGLETRSFAVINQSTTDTVVIGGTSGLVSSPFTAIILPDTLLPGAGGEVAVSFSPDAAVSYRDTLHVSVPGTDPAVILIGRGVSGPWLEATPTTVDFDTVAARRSGSRTLLLTNSGTQSDGVLRVSLSSIGGVQSSAFRLVSHSKGQLLSIPARETRQVELEFSPTAGGSHTAVLALQGDTTLAVPLVGFSEKGTPPWLDVAPATIDFDTVAAGHNARGSLLLMNSGTQSDGVLRVSLSNIGGVQSSAFRLVSHPKGQLLSIPSREVRQVELEFSPTEGGSHTAVLALQGDTTLAVPLVGFSEKGTPPWLEVAPATVDFDTVAAGHSGRSTALLTNSGTQIDGVLRVSLSSIGGVQASAFRLVSHAEGQLLSIPARETRQVELEFSPTAGGSHAAVLALQGDTSLTIPLVGFSNRGTPPWLEVVPATVDFGTTSLGIPARYQLVLSNSGTQEGGLLSISLPGISGADASSFRLVNVTTGSQLSLLSGQSRIVEVEYAPSAAGSHSAVLELAADTVLAVPLVGLGEPLVALEIAGGVRELAFGDQQAGQSGAAMTVTVANRSVLRALQIQVQTSLSEFVLAGSESLTLQPGNSTSIGVRFAPVSVGAKSELLTITALGEGTSEVVALTGTGTGAEIEVLQDSLDFGAVTVGASASSRLAIGNAGLDQLGATISSPTPPFHVSATSISVAPGSVGYVTVTYSPEEVPAGSRHSGTIAVGSNSWDDNSSRIALTGEVLRPWLSMSAQTLRFGSVRVGSSATAAVTLSNSGTDVLSVSDVASGDPQFGVEAPALPLSLGVGQSASMTATFSPGELGTHASTVTIATNDPLVPGHTMQVEGEGTAPSVVAIGDTLQFGGVRVGSTSARQFTLANTEGSAEATISSITVGSSTYDAQPSGPFSILPGDSRIVSVTFAPQDDGLAATAVTVRGDLTGDSSSEEERVYVSGFGISPRAATVPDSIGFGGVRLQDNYATLTVQNVGQDILTVSSVAAPSGSGFHVDSDGFSLTPGEGRNIEVRFKPEAEGVHSEDLLILSDDPRVPSLRVPLTGTGQVSRLAYDLVDFGHVRVSTTEPRTVEVTNTGNASVTIESFGRVPHVGVLTDPPVTIPAGLPVSLLLEYSPVDTSEITTDLAINLDDPLLGQNAISLRGRGVAPWLISPVSEGVNFGDVVRNNATTGRGESDTLAVLIQNVGNAAAIIADTRLTTGLDESEFSIVNPLRGATIPPGGSDSILVVYTPVTEGEHRAIVRMESETPDTEFDIRLFGAGIAAVGTSLDLLVTFSDTKINLAGEDAHADTMELVLGASGRHTLIIDSLRVTVGDTIFEVISPDTAAGPVEIPYGTQQRIIVRFVPTVTAAGGAGEIPFAGELTIYTNETDQLSRVVGLAGTGRASVWSAPDSVAFGEVPVNGRKRVAVVIANEGETEAVLSAWVFDDTGQFETDVESVRVPAHGTREPLVAFAPKTRNENRPIKGVLYLTEAVSGIERRVELHGLGTQGVMEVIDTEVRDRFVVRRNQEVGRDIIVSNTGNRALNVRAESQEPQFVVRANDASFELAADSTRRITVTFQPQDGGTIVGAVQVRDTEADSATVIVELTGFGLQPELDARPVEMAPVEFGRTQDASLILANTGSDPLKVDSIRVEGGFGPYLLHTSDDVDKKVIPVGEELRVPVRLLADTVGLFGRSELTLTIHHESAELEDSSAATSHVIGIAVLDTTSPVVSLVDENSSIEVPPLPASAPDSLMVRIVEETGQLALDQSSVWWRLGGAGTADYQELPIRIFATDVDGSGTTRLSGWADPPELSPGQGGRGFLYYVRVVDEFGPNETVLDRGAANRTRSLAGGGAPLSQRDIDAREIRVHVRDGLNGPTLTGARSASGPEHAYRLVSVPLDLDAESKTVASVLALTLQQVVDRPDSEKWRLYRWNDGRTEEYKPGTSAGWDFQVGQAYWFVVREDGLTLRAGAGYSVSTTEDFTMELDRGWNLVGTPYSFDVPWEHVYLDNGATKTTDSIRPSHLRAFGPQYYVDGKTGLVDSTAGKSGWSLSSQLPGEAMEPWRGYAVYATTGSASLRVRPLAVGAAAKPTGPGIGGWQLRLMAETERGYDGDNVLGVATGVDEVGMWPEPPRLASGLRAYFWSPQDSTGAQYSGDIRAPSSDGYIWDFRVEQAQRNDELSVTVGGVESGPRGLRVVLLDMGTMETFDLRSVGVLSLGADQVYDLKIIAGSSPFVQETVAAVRPTRTTLRVNYPNPFNASTVIRYTLSQPSPVELGIYSVAGQLVRKLVREDLTPGTYTATWHGRDELGRAVATGVYISRLHTTDGVQTEKLLLVK